MNEETITQETPDVLETPVGEVSISSEYFEELKALFLSDSEETLREQPRIIFRWKKGSRRYFDRSLNWFHSVTTLIEAALPKGYGLRKWEAEQGSLEAAQAIADAAADYGTFMHVLIQQFLLSEDRSIDLSDSSLNAKIDLFVSENTLKDGPPTSRRRAEWIRKARSDLWAFAKFASDYNLEPVAIEHVLAAEEPIPDGADQIPVAGAIDLVAYITHEVKGFWGEVYKGDSKDGKRKKGDPKETKKRIRELVIIDFKSGRKGFYEEHEFQLEIYRRIWNFNFPDLCVEKIFDWAPKDWKISPGYHFRDQTGKHDQVELNSFLRWAITRLPLEPPNPPDLAVRLEFGKDPGMPQKKTYEQILAEGGVMMDEEKESEDGEGTLEQHDPAA